MPRKRENFNAQRIKYYIRERGRKDDLRNRAKDLRDSLAFKIREGQALSSLQNEITELRGIEKTLRLAPFVVPGETSTDDDVNVTDETFDESDSTDNSEVKN
jgi:hypothetical protein